MDFQLSDEQVALRENARAVLDKHCPPALVRQVFEGEEERGQELWKQMVDHDWPGLGVPVSVGGLGLTQVEVAILAQELGRAVAPGPYFATATQFIPLLLETATPDQLERYLVPIPRDGATGCLALAEPSGRWDPGEVSVAARRSETGWIVEGRKSFVVDGASAQHVAVVARGEAGLGAFVVSSDAVEAQAIDVIDPTLPVAHVDFVATEVSDTDVLVEPGDPGGTEKIQRALDGSVTALSASLVGTCRAIFEETLQYVKDREQYGRPIGSFQAVKHRLADMYLALERADALAFLAAMTIAEESPRRRVAVSMAKAAAGECQRLLVQEALQLHGGIGYTWEHDLHMFLKRAKAVDALFGSASYHRAEVARLVGLAGSAGEPA